jgi:hypothetical protein
LYCGQLILAQVKIKRHAGHVYACRNCERDETELPTVTALACPDHQEEPGVSGSDIVDALRAEGVLELCWRIGGRTNRGDVWGHGYANREEIGHR